MRQTPEEVKKVNLEACKRYRKTEAYKESQKRYKLSSKGKARNCSYAKSYRDIKAKGSILEGDEWNDFVFQEIYELRDQRNNETNIEWHVDHIIPIKGKNVHGLNVWNNLQLIPAVQNIYKANNILEVQIGAS